jgi:cardiolipin synthase (CMP-forming)
MVFPMPRITTATYFTFLRFAMVPFFAVAVAKGWYGWALALFAAAAATDGVDGFIARQFNQRSRLGATLDPLADKALLITAFIALTFLGGVRHRMPAFLTAPALGRDVIIVVGTAFLMRHRGWFDYKPHWTSKCNTVAQIAAVLIVLLMNFFFANGLAPRGWAIARDAACGAALVLTVVSVAAYAWIGTAILIDGPDPIRYSVRHKPTPANPGQS